MKKALLKAGRREIGGIVMGKQLNPGTFEIVDFSLDAVSGARAHFVRDVEHHTKALSEFFDRTGHDYQTFNYLGEWHSHPSFPLTPSAVDVESMVQLVAGERGIEFAMLMIVKIDLLYCFRASATLHTTSGIVEHVDISVD